MLESITVSAGPFSRSAETRSGSLSTAMGTPPKARISSSACSSAAGPGDGDVVGGTDRPVTSGLSGKCLNAGATRLVNITENGNPAQLGSCDGGASQSWTWTNGALTHEGLCLDVTGGATTNGAKVELWECNGGANQQWQPRSDGTVKGAQSGRCLDDPNVTTTDGTQLVIWDCNGGVNQKWTLPK